MRFQLFSKIEFEVSDPIALIECFCIQNDFFTSYDMLIHNRHVKDVNKIGARIKKYKLPTDEELAQITKSASLFSYKLDGFLNLSDSLIKQYVKKACMVVEQLMAREIGFSQTTKVLHTVYPYIFPMIDGLLQDQYKGIHKEWKPTDPGQILFDYYINLKRQPTRRNLSLIFEKVKNNLPYLTEIRIFDVLWWSFLKAKKLDTEHDIKVNVIKQI